MTITRTAYVTALRNLADLFEDRDTLPLPYEADELTFYVRLLPEALAMHALMVRPVITRDTSTFPVRIKGTLAGMRAEVAIHGDVALSAEAPVLPALVPALAALMDPTGPLVHAVPA